MKCLDPNQVCAKIADFRMAQYVYEPMTIVGKTIQHPVWLGTHKLRNIPIYFPPSTNSVLAPEVSMCLPYDETVDTYSVGVIFYEIITREKYFGYLSELADIQRRYDFCSCFFFHSLFFPPVFLPVTFFPSLFAFFCFFFG